MLNWSLFSWIIEVLSIMNFFQKVKLLIKSTFHKVCVACVKSFVKRDQIHAQTIHGFCHHDNSLHNVMIIRELN